MKQKNFDSKIVKLAQRDAKAARETSDCGRYRLGASIFTNKKVLVSTCNTAKASRMQRKYNHLRGFEVLNDCSHAEMNALTKFKHLYPKIKAKDVSIFVYREDKDGSYAIAKPCRACEQALRDFGITNIYYTGVNSLCYEQYILKD